MRIKKESVGWKQGKEGKERENEMREMEKGIGMEKQKGSEEVQYVEEKEKRGRVKMKMEWEKV